MPGSHMWQVKTWQSGAYRDLGRLAEADAVRDESLAAIRHMRSIRSSKRFSVCTLNETPTRRCIQAARLLGMELAQAERLWRRAHPNSPTREPDIAIVRKLYAATEAGA